MRKEIGIAIFIGILLGLVVTYGIYTANEALRNRNSNAHQIGSSLIPSPTPTVQAPLILTLISPEDGSVTEKPDIVVGGTTAPAAAIVIVTDDNEYLAEADANGMFSQTLTLIRGANTIQITASDTNQISTTKTVRIVYTTDLETKN